MRLLRSARWRSDWQAWCPLHSVSPPPYGGALRVDSGYPKWIGALAILGGVPTAAAGVVIAYAGFSRPAMAMNMPANSILLIWMLALGACMWRRGVSR